jgi:HSP20 family protein
MSYAPWAPPVDILRSPSYWCVKIELAGVCPDNIEISADGTILTVRGDRRDTLLSHGFTYQSLEINYSTFERRIGLPFVIDQSRISCQYQDGFLLIQIQSTA